MAKQKEKTVLMRQNWVQNFTLVGEAKISENYTYTYQLVKLPNNEQYKRFVELAKEISAFSDNANSYSNIMKTNEFYNLYNTLMPTTWKNEVKNNKINEPEDSRHGEQYVVWIKATNGEQEVVDVQFMTCAREETEERSTEIVKEEVTTTTKLPLTFDATMTLIVVLGIIIVAIVILLVIKKPATKTTSNITIIIIGFNFAFISLDINSHP